MLRCTSNTFGGNFSYGASEADACRCCRCFCMALYSLTVINGIKRKYRTTAEITPSSFLFLIVNVFYWLHRRDFANLFLFVWVLCIDTHLHGFLLLGFYFWFCAEWKWTLRWRRQQKFFYYHEIRWDFTTFLYRNEIEREREKKKMNQHIHIYTVPTFLFKCQFAFIFIWIS